jgi:hypothetical protein
MDLCRFQEEKWNFMKHGKNRPFQGHHKFFSQEANLNLRIGKIMALFRAPAGGK